MGTFSEKKYLSAETEVMRVPVGMKELVRQFCLSQELATLREEMKFLQAALAQYKRSRRASSMKSSRPKSKSKQLRKGK